MDVVTTKRRSLLRSLCVAALLAAPRPAGAQQWIASGWVGGGTESNAGDVGFTPQGSLRAELSPVANGWIGGEVALAFRFEEMSCPASGGCGNGLLPSPFIAAFARYEVGGDYRPYVITSIGRSFTTYGFDTVGLWGLGAGVRARRDSRWSSYFIEARYRNTARFESSSTHHVELVVGLGLGN